MPRPHLVALLALIVPAAARAQEAIAVVRRGADALGFYATDDGRPLASVPVGSKPHEVEVSADGQPLIGATSGALDALGARRVR